MDGDRKGWTRMGGSDRYGEKKRRREGGGEKGDDRNIGSGESETVGQGTGMEGGRK